MTPEATIGDDASTRKTSMQVMPVVEVFVSSLQDMPPFLGLFRLKMNVNYGRVPKRLAFLKICALRLEKGLGR